MNKALSKFKILEHNPTIKSNCGLYTRPFYITKKIIYCDIEFSIRFIKKVESIVRKHPDYKNYLAYVKGDLKLNRCAVYGNIDDEGAPIELHHGPIINLFDICRLIMLKQVDEFDHATTFTVAEEVLDLHYQNKIQFVMLCETAHQTVHGGNRFINLRQAYGDLAGFISIIKDYLSDYQINVIRKYVKLSEKYQTDILDIMELGEDLGEFGY